MNPIRTAVCAAIVGLLAMVVPLSSKADRNHEVASGQTLSSIAHRYGVSTSTLASANGLAAGDLLRPGQVLQVPARGVVYVSSGDTLSSIARTNRVTVPDLARANRLSESGTLRVGQRLVLPGYERNAGEAEAAQPSRDWGQPTRPGFARLMRFSTREQIRMRLLDERGRVRPAARNQLGRLMHHRGTGRVKKPNPRLLQLLARVSDHFGGRTLYVVSGFRPAGGYTRKASRHTRGQAIDFRVQGVPNTVLRDYCRRLGNTGVGYYPRSTFVHLDVRDRNAYWVDWSSPGERPMYRRAADGPPQEIFRRSREEDEEPGTSADVRVSASIAEAGETADVDADDGTDPPAIVIEDEEPK